ncbi:radical SAM protein [Dehalogenimonas etheniformans]|uniref:Radical SAM protein n=1 Tax=Dehalogenimonas etheniformans TaxID=1536648 RepID=A0A2P5P787_9CHLR|nr:radical SAM protein [Dehalogenimonas etheniformans]PPD58154.1 radical SAM protein [Dehalogenimonas etheniformans]QNT75562.1 radical SAM protein [Dehalogenimonas etheniformans]
MNLVLTRACSNSCPYCFESAEREDGRRGAISLENVATFVKWASNSRLDYLSLLGGEPFLHPKLSTIVKMFRQASPGTSIRILSGGIFNKELLDELPPQEISIVFNINEPRDYRNPKHLNKVINNVEAALKKGFKVSIGFNVWRLDFDPDFIPNLARQFGLSRFTWTVANPIRGIESKVVPTTEFPALAERCMVMLRKAAALNLEANLDCPVPLCFFKDSDLAWIRQYHPGTASGMGPCAPVLDVTPELEVLRCFALSKSVRLKLTDFHSEKEIEDWFMKHLDTQFLGTGCFDYCAECPHFQKGRCYGGCLACHGYGQPGETDLSAATLEKTMHQAIEAGNADLALSLYKKASFWSKTDLATFAAAVAASKSGDWTAAYHYAIDANNRAHDPVFMRMIGDFITHVVAPNLKEGTSYCAEQNRAGFISCPSQTSVPPKLVSK